MTGHVGKKMGGYERALQIMFSLRMEQREHHSDTCT